MKYGVFYYTKAGRVDLIIGLISSDSYNDSVKKMIFKDDLFKAKFKHVFLSYNSFTNPPTKYEDYHTIPWLEWKIAFEGVFSTYHEALNYLFQEIFA